MDQDPLRTPSSMKLPSENQHSNEDQHSHPSESAPSLLSSGLSSSPGAQISDHELLLDQFTRTLMLAESSEDRALAAQRLGELRDLAGKPYLVAALYDEVPEVCRAAQESINLLENSDKSFNSSSSDLSADNLAEVAREVFGFGGSSKAEPSWSAAFEEYAQSFFQEEERYRTAVTDSEAAYPSLSLVNSDNTSEDSAATLPGKDFSEQSLDDHLRKRQETSDSLGAQENYRANLQTQIRQQEIRELELQQEIEQLAREASEQHIRIEAAQLEKQVHEDKLSQALLSFDLVARSEDEQIAVLAGLEQEAKAKAERRELARKRYETDLEALTSREIAETEELERARTLLQQTLDAARVRADKAQQQLKELQDLQSQISAKEAELAANDEALEAEMAKLAEKNAMLARQDENRLQLELQLAEISELEQSLHLELETLAQRELMEQARIVTARQLLEDARREAELRQEEEARLSAASSAMREAEAERSRVAAEEERERVIAAAKAAADEEERRIETLETLKTKAMEEAELRATRESELINSLSSLSAAASEQLQRLELQKEELENQKRAIEQYQQETDRIQQEKAETRAQFEELRQRAEEAVLKQALVEQEIIERIQVLRTEETTQTKEIEKCQAELDRIEYRLAETAEKYAELKRAEELKIEEESRLHDEAAKEQKRLVEEAARMRAEEDRVRQAELAQLKQRLEEESELRTAEETQVRSELARLSAINEGLLRELEVLTSQVVLQQSANQIAEARLAAAGTENDRLRTEMDSLKQQESETLQVNQVLDAQVKRAEELAVELVARGAELSAELDRYSKSQSEQLRRIDILTARIANQRQLKLEADERLKTTTAEEDELVGQLAALEERESLQRARLAELKTALEDARDANLKRTEEEQQRLAELEANRSRVAAEAQEAARREQQLLAELESLKESQTSAANRMADLTLKVHAREAELGQLNEQIKDGESTERDVVLQLESLTTQRVSQLQRIDQIAERIRLATEESEAYSAQEADLLAQEKAHMEQAANTRRKDAEERLARAELDAENARLEEERNLATLESLKASAALEAQARNDKRRELEATIALLDSQAAEQEASMESLTAKIQLQQRDCQEAHALQLEALQKEEQLKTQLEELLEHTMAVQQRIEQATTRLSDSSIEIACLEAHEQEKLQELESLLTTAREETGKRESQRVELEKQLERLAHEEDEHLIRIAEQQKFVQQQEESCREKVIQTNKLLLLIEEQAAGFEAFKKRHGEALQRYDTTRVEINKGIVDLNLIEETEIARVRECQVALASAEKRVAELRNQHEELKIQEASRRADEALAREQWIEEERQQAETEAREAEEAEQHRLAYLERIRQTTAAEMQRREEQASEIQAQIDLLTQENVKRHEALEEVTQRLQAEQTYSSQYEENYRLTLSQLEELTKANDARREQIAKEERRCEEEEIRRAAEQDERRLRRLEEMRTAAEVEALERSAREQQLSAELERQQELEKVQMERIAEAKELLRASEKAQMEANEELALLREETEANLQARATLRAQAVEEQRKRAEVEARIQSEKDAELAAQLSTIKAQAEQESQALRMTEARLQNEIDQLTNSSADYRQRISSLNVEVQEVELTQRELLDQQNRLRAEVIEKQRVNAELRRQAAEEEQSRIEAEANQRAADEQQRIARLEAERQRLSQQAVERGDEEQKLVAEISQLQLTRNADLERIGQLKIQLDAERAQVEAARDVPPTNNHESGSGFTRVELLEMLCAQLDTANHRLSEKESSLLAQLESLQENEKRKLTELEKISARSTEQETMFSATTEQHRSDEVRVDQSLSTARGEEAVQASEQDAVSRGAVETESKKTSVNAAAEASQADSQHAEWGTVDLSTDLSLLEDSSESTVSPEEYGAAGNDFVFSHTPDPAADIEAEQDHDDSLAASWDLQLETDHGQPVEGDGFEMFKTTANQEATTQVQEKRIEVREEVAPNSIEPLRAEKGITPIQLDSSIPLHILEGLTSGDPDARSSAVGAVARFGGDDAFELITNCFGDAAPEVRNAAALALYELDGDRAATFTRALREASPERRRTIGATIASSGLAKSSISRLEGEGREKTYDAFSILFLMAKAGEVRPLIDAVENHPNTSTRLAVIRLLTFSSQDEIVPIFRRLVVRASLPAEVRSAAMEAIHELTSQESGSVKHVA